MSYAELHCLTNFSFLRGASHPAELVQQAVELGYSAIAITDECSVAGVVRAYVALRDLRKVELDRGIKLIIGSEFHSQDGLHFIMLAPDIQAYGQLSSLISRARRRSEKGEYQIKANDLAKATDGCLFIWLPTLAQCVQPDEACLQIMRRTQNRLWIGLHNNLAAQDEEIFAARTAFSAKNGLPLVACGNVLCHKSSRQPLQDVLTAIRLNTSVHQAGFALQANRENYLRSLEELEQRFPAIALEQTEVIARRCKFELNQLKYQYPHELIPDGYTAQTYLRELVERGVGERWPEGVDRKTRDLIEKEMQIIHELEYESYFITVYDIVHFARTAKILCQGRGSAANSAVCYCLHITEVNPATSSLLFERFISRERKEPPDIDVDFEHERREEVIQFIYRKYSRERAALTATVISYRTKSTVRDVGKALGFDQTLLDSLSQSLAWWDRRDELPQRLRELGIDPEQPRIRQFKWLVDQLRGFPRHLSQHVGGFIISSGPLDQQVPIENASMKDRTVVQWDKDDIEALGLMKIDVLALGMLTAIRKSFALLQAVRGADHTMAKLLLKNEEDKATYAMLQKGDSVGVFQVESRAQMAMLPRLRPERFYDLVIQVAIVRPGPIQGDMVHPYLQRRQNQKAVTYESDDLKPVLERTLGIPIFQEQVISLAMVAAGFTGGEADQLRRAMAAWKRKGGLEPYEKKLEAGMLERGYSPEFIQRIIAQIRGFGDYGFPES
ncbi:MAG TPA: error-prone DNA polymerase, partial [Dongiaceae bacterium]|nr:error-prone DNA polymerase [Dongiaceae bacterium]